jgi:tetratricopeptide (TPR) repeat protein
MPSAKRLAGALGLAGAALLAAAGAVHAQARQDCGGPDMSRWIAGCGLIIDNASEAAADRARAYKYRGIANYQTGRVDASIADMTAALALNPNDAEVLSNRGLALRAKNQLDASIADLDKALSLNPALAYAHFNRAITWELKGDLARARADYDDAIRLKSDVPGFFKLRGLLRPT